MICFEHGSCRNNHLLGAEFRYTSCGQTRGGNGNDYFCAHVASGGSGGITNCVGNVGGIGIITNAVIHIHIKSILFGLLCNLCHNANNQSGVVACGSLARKHNGRGTVKNSICNVGDFGTCRSRGMNHRFQHLGCGNDHLTRLIALANKSLLQAGQTFKCNLNAHVTTCNHNTVGVAENCVKVVNTLNVFNF